MNYKLLLYLTATMCAGGSAFAQTNMLSLDAVVGEVLSNNPALRAGRAHWEAMRERIPQARAWEDMKFGFDATAARFVDVPANSFSDQRLSVEQTLPISGKNRLRGQAANAAAAGEFARWKRQQLDFTVRARTAYFRLANAYAQLELNRKNAVLWKELAETSRNKYRTGTQSEADVLGAEMELAKLDEASADFQRDIADRQIELNGLMNRPGQTALGRPVVPELRGPHWALETLETLALEHRPEMLMAAQSVLEANSRLTAAHREWIPEPGLRLEAARYNGAAQAVSEIDLGFSINLPWFNRGKYRAGIQENQDLLESAQHEWESARLETLTAVQRQLIKVETFHHHAELFQSKLRPLAAETAVARMRGYETDKGIFSDVLAAQQSQQDIESMYWEHLTDYEISVAELEALVGTDLSPL